MSGRLTPPVSAWALAMGLLVVAAPGALGDAGSTPASRVDDLIFLIFVVSLGVGGFVFVFLFVALWWFREGSPRERGTPVTESPKLELAWTAAPAAIVVVIAILSAQTILAIEEPPESTVHIQVTGHQWFWEFQYPDGTTVVNELWVEEGRTVVLEVTSADVIHSFFLPKYNFKIDAFPDRINTAWFVAEGTGNYSITCAEFCGAAHSQMRGTLVVFEPEPGRPPFGPPPSEEPPPPPPGAGAIVDIELLNDPFSINPNRLTLTRGEPVSLRIWNNGTMTHNLKIDVPVDLFSGDVPAGGTAWLNFTPAEATGGTAYWCDVPGHRQAGMEGLLVVTGPLEIEVDLFDRPGAEPWGIEPAQLEFQPGDEVHLTIRNTGTIPHNLALGPPYDLVSDTIGPGKVTWLNFTAASSVDYWCDIPGHRQAGMEGQMTVGVEGPPIRAAPLVFSSEAIALTVLAVVGFLATLAAALRPRDDRTPAEESDGPGGSHGE